MDTKTFPAEGIRRLLIEEMGRYARLVGDAGTTAVQVTYLPAGSSGEFTVEGDTLIFRGGLVVRASLPPELDVTVAAATGELRVQDLAGRVEITSVARDLRLKRLKAKVEIGSVGGGVRADELLSLRLIEGCGGDLHGQAIERLFVGSAGSDVRLYQMGSVHLGRVRGDLRVELQSGRLELAAAGGDVRLLDIAGPVILQQVAGDLRALGLMGGLQADSVAGDAELHGPFGETAEYALAAAGDISLYLTTAAHIRLSAQAGSRIRSDVNLTPAPDGSALFTGSVGRAVAPVGLRAGGNLRIVQLGDDEAPGSAASSADTMDLNRLGERIRQQASASLAAVGIGPATEQVTSRWPAVDLRDGLHPQVAKPREPLHPEVLPPVQMAILSMVEAGTMTAEQAEVLFEALGE